jgi:hypothetical protein
MRQVLLSCRLELIASLLVVAAIMLTGCMRRTISVEQVDRMIKEQVPIGSDKQQVKAFIDNLKIGSLEIYRDKEFHRATPDALGNSDPEKVAALGDRIAEFTGCYISKTESDGFITFRGISITFYIDKDGRMIDYTVRQSDEI